MKLPDKTGHFGQFGGRFVPETLMTLLIDLEKEFNNVQKAYGGNDCQFA